MVSENCTAIHPYRFIVSMVPVNLRPLEELEESVAAAVFAVTARVLAPRCKDCDGRGDRRCAACDGRGCTSNSQGVTECAECGARGRRMCRRCGGMGHG
jgi:hypothetical protein